MDALQDGRYRLAMCNEYARAHSMDKLIQYMEEMKHVPPFEYLEGRIPNDTEARNSIRIRDKAIVARLKDGKLLGESMTWAWQAPTGKPVFNFVSEGRDFSKTDRVVIPATGFYEYTKPENPKVKLKDQHLFTLKESEWFWIAGIVKNNCFSMLTTAPGPDLKPYHDRQICILAPERGADWLALSQPQEKLLAAIAKGSLAVEGLRVNGVATS